MSWTTRLEVHLRPATVALRRARSWSVGGAPKLLSLPPRGPEAGEPWREPLHALVRELDAARERGSALEVVLSDHFVRFALLPFSADLVRDEERRAFARMTFAQVYGPTSEGWDIALDERLSPAPAIAVAIDRSLLQALRELCSARRMRLASVVPAFVRDLNRHRRLLRASTFWLARTEPGRVTLALRRGGAWAAVRTRRLDAAGAEPLARALRQEALACAAPAQGALYLIDSSGAVQSVPGWHTTRLGSAAVAAAAPRAVAAR